MNMEIPVINWFEDPIKESINSVFHGINSRVEALDIFNKYRKIHFEMLKQLVGNVKILGMQEPVDLKDLYYPATISTNIRRRMYAAEWALLDDDQKSVGLQKIKSIEEGDSYVENHSRIVVLGGPGAGKTTFLRFLALAYSDKSIFAKTKLTTSYLPIYLHLPLLAREHHDITEGIFFPLRKRNKTDKYCESFYTRVLENGSCVVLLDSLDEVPVEFKKDIIQKINQFANQYPKARIIISCRTADYDQVFQDFTEVELAPLTKKAVSSIVKAWFGNDIDKSKKLLSLLEHDDAVAALTETPLLLSLLCIQFKNDLALPKRKAELYRRCVDALVRDWDTKRGFRRDTSYSQLSDDSKEKIFEAVAGNACKESIEYKFSEPFVVKEISNEIARFSLDPNDAKGILLEIESHHGIIEKCSAETYQFSHGTMQEYFAARYFVAKRLEMEVIKKNYENEEWYNIIIFMSAILDDPTNLLDFLVTKSFMGKFQNYPAFARRMTHLWLLYRCMAMGVSITPELRSSICTHLVNSQMEMLKQLHIDGVMPFAARIPNGARQQIFYYKKVRESLNAVLKPYRSLMNEMVLCPIKEYAEKVVSTVDDIKPENISNLYARTGLITCLLVPISDVKPEYFLKKMTASAESLPPTADVVKSVLTESISFHASTHTNIKSK
jgi:energy-coupling factor transporter ATP-binding protein EcfA2